MSALEHEQGTQQESQAEPPGQVLVVEDDPGTRTLLAELLTTEGYAVQVAANGIAALVVVERWRPDVILLDMVMPGADGVMFARAYRQTPPPHAPIIVLTASPITPEQVAAVAPVATRRKPFELDDLLALVRQYRRRT